MTPLEFIAAIKPAALATQANTGIPASFTIAQAALESAWGKSGLSVQACNLFGVKADASWSGDVLCLPTKEFLKGEWVVVQAKWRKYKDWQGCTDDHAAFLVKNPRYKPAFSFKTGIQFAQAVARAGYATDPNYASKITQIITTHNLNTLDAK